MKIPSIPNFVTSGARYFLQSSWKGRTVQVLCAASFLTLIYYVFFRSKKKTPSDGPEPPAKLNVVHVEKTTAKPEKPVEANLPYKKTASATPDFIQACKGNFGEWLSERMGLCEEWTRMACGSELQQASCCAVLRRFVSELKGKVEEMIPVFKANPNVRTDKWDAFLQECDTVSVTETKPADRCAKLKTFLEKLKAWNAALDSQYQAKLNEQLSNVENHPHYEFTDLHEQYLTYLGLRSKEDFSKFLSTKRKYLANVGLVEMADIDLLQLRAMQPSIEKLKQLFCIFSITKNEKDLKPLIEQEIENCREVLRGSDNLSDEMKNGQELKDNVRLLRGLFGTLSRSVANVLDLLKEIERIDIARQLIQLKGYLHQQGHLAKWKQLNEAGIFGLSLYAERLDIKTLTPFYQMGD